MFYPCHRGDYELVAESESSLWRLLTLRSYLKRMMQVASLVVNIHLNVKCALDVNLNISRTSSIMVTKSMIKYTYLLMADLLSIRLYFAIQTL